MGDSDISNFYVIAPRPARIHGKLDKFFPTIGGAVDAGGSGVVNGVFVMR